MSAEPVMAVPTLRKLAQLLELPVDYKRLWLAIDLDHTLLRPKETGSSLVTEIGMAHAARILALDGCPLPPSWKAEIQRRLSSIMNTYTLVEENSLAVLKELHRRGARVFALTTRLSKDSAATLATLRSLNFSFAALHPFPVTSPLHDPKTGAQFVEGVVFTNGYSKSDVLCTLLQSFPEAWRYAVGLSSKPLSMSDKQLEEKDIQAESGADVAARVKSPFSSTVAYRRASAPAPASPLVEEKSKEHRLARSASAAALSVASAPRPSPILALVDDVEQNVVDVMTSQRLAACGFTALWGWQFQPLLGESRTKQPLVLKETTFRQTVDYQLCYFIVHGVLLTDQQVVCASIGLTSFFALLFVFCGLQRLYR